MKGISEKTLIKIKDLKASVKLNNGDMLTTVTNANMELQRGRSYAIVGKSGSGKTSLISIIGLLNREYEGEYLYDGVGWLYYIHDIPTFEKSSRLCVRGTGCDRKNVRSECQLH